MSINQLPDEMIMAIYEILMPDDKIAIAATCTRFYSLRIGFARWFTRCKLIARDISSIDYQIITPTMSSRHIATSTTLYVLGCNKKYHDILKAMNSRIPLEPSNKFGDPPTSDIAYMATYVDNEYCGTDNTQYRCTLSHGLVDNQ